MFLLLWASVNCYSRIYLGVHYPGDLLVGTIIGLCSAMLCFYVFRHTIRWIITEHRRTARVTLSFLAPVGFDRANFHIADAIIATGLLTVAVIALYARFA